MGLKKTIKKLAILIIANVRLVFPYMFMLRLNYANERHK